MKKYRFIAGRKEKSGWIFFLPYNAFILTLNKDRRKSFLVKE